MRILSLVALIVALTAFYCPALAQDAAVPAEWKSLDLAGLTKLAVDLTGKGQASAEQCQKLATFVAQKFDSASSAGAVPWDQWMGLANVLAPRYPAATRQAMVKSIQKQLIPTPQATSELEYGLVQMIALCLERLGQPKLSGLACANWIDGSEDYKKMDLEYLCWFIRYLHQVKDEGRSARVKVCQLITKVYCADSAEAKKARICHWLAFACLADELPEQTRTIWAQKITSVFGDAKTLAQGGDYYQFSEALRVLGAKWPAKVALKLVEGKDWQSWTADQQGQLAIALAEAGQEGQKGRSKLAAFVTEKYAVGVGASGAVSAADWRIFATALGKDVNAADRRTWADRVQEAHLAQQDFGLEWLEVTGILGDQGTPAARESIAQNVFHKFTPTPQATAKLHYTLVHQIAATFTSLGKTELAASACANWIGGSDGYKEMDLDTLCWFIGYIADSDSPESKSARARLIDHVTQKYCASKDAAASIRLACWGCFAVHLNKELPEQTKALWVKTIRSAFADAGRLQQAGDFDGLNQALRSLGAPVPVDVAVQVTEGKAWQSWKSEDLAELAQTLNCSGDEGKPARQALGKHITSQYIANSSAIQSVSLGAWQIFSLCCGRQLSQDDRREWLTKLRDQYGNTTFLKDGNHFVWFVEVMQNLGQLPTPGLAIEIVEKADWKSWRTGELAYLARSLSYVGVAGKSARAELTKYVESKYLASPQAIRSLNSWEWEQISLCVAHDMSPEAAHGWGQKLQEAFSAGPQSITPMPANQVLMLSNAIVSLEKKGSSVWAMKAYDALVGDDQCRQKATGLDLVLLSEALTKAGLTGKGKGYKGYAAALALLAKKDKLAVSLDQFDFPRLWAVPLGTEEARTILQAELLDGQGGPRVSVVQILTWSYQETGEIAKWQKMLDEKIAVAKGDADAKARWLAARAIAQTTSAGQESPLAGKKFLDQALAAASSDQCRLEVLELLVRAYELSGDHREARQILDSYVNQLGEPQATAAKRLRKTVEQDQEDYLWSEAQEQAKVSQQQLNSQISNLNRQLDDARQRGDQQAVKQLEDSLKKAKNG